MQKSIHILFGSHLDRQTKIKGFEEFNKDKGKIGKETTKSICECLNKLSLEFIFSFSSCGDSLQRTISCLMETTVVAFTHSVIAERSR